MEVLNQNQRRSAIWRILALGVLILAIFGTIVASMHKAYASLGKGDLEALQAKYNKEHHLWEGEKKGLENERKSLKKKLNDCRAKDDEPDQRLQLCEDRIKGKDDRIDELEKDLTRCQTQLQAARVVN